jgi:hypothetical protein
VGLSGDRTRVEVMKPLLVSFQFKKETPIFLKLPCSPQYAPASGALSPR